MKTERILLSPSEWWIGKKDGKLLAVMFAHRGKDGNLNVEWEVLDESNLPVDLIRRNGEEYTFVLPVGLDRRAAVQEECVGVGVDDPESTTDTCALAAGAATDLDTMALAGGICGGEVADGGPVEGIAGHGVCGSENSSTNVRCAPIGAIERRKK